MFNFFDRQVDKDKNANNFDMYILTVQSLLFSIDPTSSKYHNAQTLTDLHSLAFNLLESLNDKSTALSHLRKTNRFCILS